MVDKSLRLNLVFAALSHPIRRRLLETLAAGERTVMDLARPFALSLQAVSKHLRVLEEAGLLRRTREGRVHRMSAAPEGARDAQEWLQRYAQGWHEQLDALEQFLRRQDAPEPKDPS